MKHFYLVTLYGYTDDGRLVFPTGFAPCDGPRITQEDLNVVIDEINENDDRFKDGVALHSVSYLGSMTEDAFEHLRSMPEVGADED
ncbi:hypothetical protein QQ994_01325 [Pseudomonas asiatica]|uniref:hypothetical protein n=1 Tax=Pseudomonas TaxID=286 RepID=UPI0025708A84|nr:MULTISPECIES: hypothetical protein [Pseudomonas]MDV5098375.1 hypothetical protein [Pseudomonas sp. LSJ-87]WJD70550.1 hypothetical protein QQ994_01325 [Pseudomonas asiatica]